MSLTFGVEMEMFVERTFKLINIIAKELVKNNSVKEYIQNNEEGYSKFNKDLSCDMVDKIDEILNSNALKDRKIQEIADFLQEYRIRYEEIDIIALIVTKLLCKVSNNKNLKRERTMMEIDQDQPKKRKRTDDSDGSLSNSSSKATTRYNHLVYLDVPYNKSKLALASASNPTKTNENKDVVIYDISGCDQNTKHIWTLDIDISVSFKIADITEKIMQPIYDCQYGYRSIYDKQEAICFKDVIPYFEFVSGIFQSPQDAGEGVRMLIKHLNKLSTEPINASQTSNHIHFAPKDGRDFKKDHMLVYCVQYVWFIFQDIFYDMCHSNRRQSKYCQPLVLDDMFRTASYNDIVSRFTYTLNREKNSSNGIWSDKEAKSLSSYGPCDRIKVISKIFHDEHMEYMNGKYIVDRYMISNLKNITTKDGKPTIEIRAKHGNNSSKEIEVFCQFIEALYNIAVRLNGSCKMNKDKRMDEILDELMGITNIYMIAKDKNKYRDVLQKIFDDQSIVEFIIEHIKKMP